MSVIFRLQADVAELIPGATPGTGITISNEQVRNLLRAWLVAHGVDPTRAGRASDGTLASAISLAIRKLRSLMHRRNLWPSSAKNTMKS